MPTIQLANGVTIDYEIEDVSIGSKYKCEKSITEIADFLTAGTQFKLSSRVYEDDTNGYLFVFETDNGEKFQLVEDTFAQFLHSGEIVELEG